MERGTSLVIEAIRLGNRCPDHRVKLQLKPHSDACMEMDLVKGKESGRDTSW